MATSKKQVPKGLLLKPMFREFTFTFNLLYLTIKKNEFIFRYYKLYRPIENKLIFYKVVSDLSPIE